MYSRHRLEGLSDAIFAIVMTLLVLELKVPTDVVPGHLGEALRADGVNWLSFVITFAIAARYWMLQHNVFKLTEGFTHHAVVLTFVFLGLVTILPFTSTLVGHHGSDPLALSIYFANQSAIGFALIAKLEFIRVRDHLPKSLELAHLRQRLYVLAGTMAAAACGVEFLPLKFLLFIPLVAIVIDRTLEHRNEKHYRMQATRKSGRA